MRVPAILVSLVASFVFAPAAFGQDAMQMLQGAGRPLTLKPDGLSDQYKAIVIKTTVQGENGLMDMIMSPMMLIMGAMGGMMGGDSKDQPPVALLTAMDLDWTTGETQSLFGQTYLVIYKLDFDLSKMTAQPKDLSALELRLQFIRTDTIASMSPRPDITPVEYMKMLKTPLPKQSGETKPGN